MSLLLTNAVTLYSSPAPRLSSMSYNCKGSPDSAKTKGKFLGGKCAGTRKPLLRCLQENQIIGVRPIDREVHKSDFPSDFMFGASSSALQTEGINGGRGASIWDHMIEDHVTGSTDAIDSYHKYKDDVKMLKNMSADCYRFSISWSRILPAGTLSGGRNEDGIQFYNHLIDELIKNGIQPIVTLLHYDLPQALMKDYKGFLGKKIVDDFRDFADICFHNFGDRVKYWTTFNEPQVISGRNVYWDGVFENDQTTMPYICAHNILLAHAAAAKLYREKYQVSQGGEIGFPLAVQGCVPLTNSPKDKDAAKRAQDFSLGWYLEPLVTGEYPFIMKAILKERLPSFTDEEKKMVKGSIDFITINYYTARYIEGLPINQNDKPESYEKDQYVNQLQKDVNGVPVGPLAPGDVAGAANICPEQLKDVLFDLKNHYGNPKTYISENGTREQRQDELPLYQQLDDTHRVNYMKAHLKSVREALREGVNVKGYCMWCLLDCMELASGYSVRFGLNYIDYKDNLKRIPKKSAKWFKTFQTVYF